MFNSDYKTEFRQYSLVHPVARAPLCQKCTNLALFYFDLNCLSCEKSLQQPTTNISNIFAIIRQWTPNIQINIEWFGDEILKRGAHPDDRDGMGDMTLLQYCAKAACPDMNRDETNPGALRLARRLINLGCDLEIRSSVTSMNALHLAAFFNSTQMVKLLLSSNKNTQFINSTCSIMHNFTSLHITCNKTNLESCKTLIDEGANVYARDKRGRTPVEVIPDNSDCKNDGHCVNELFLLFFETTRKDYPGNHFLKLEAPQIDNSNIEKNSLQPELSSSCLLKPKGADMDFIQTKLLDCDEIEVIANEDSPNGGTVEKPTTHQHNNSNVDETGLEIKICDIEPISNSAQEPEKKTEETEDNYSEPAKSIQTVSLTPLLTTVTDNRPLKTETKTSTTDTIPTIESREISEANKISKALRAIKNVLTSKQGAGTTAAVNTRTNNSSKRSKTVCGGSIAMSKTSSSSPKAATWQQFSRRKQWDL